MCYIMTERIERRLADMTDQEIAELAARHHAQARKVLPDYVFQTDEPQKRENRPKADKIKNHNLFLEGETQ